MLASAASAASRAGIWEPLLRPSAESTLLGTRPLTRGPLDVLAHILAVPEIRSDAALVIEVKNIHSWIYPWTSELWELLTKAAELAYQTPVVPLLVCVRAGFPTNQMAKDVGFFGCYLGRQLFHPSIPTDRFDSIVGEFGLAIAQHEGPSDSVVRFLESTMRHTPPGSPPFDEQIPWYQRQAQRFATLAPVVLRHQALAGDSLTGPARRALLASFRAEAAEAAYQGRSCAVGSGTFASVIRLSRQPSPGGLKPAQIMQVMRMHETYYTPEQLAQLEARRE